jgi:lysophospholipase L1-like esterase
VFYAGDNDIAAGHSPDQVSADFEAFAASVHKRLPETKLIFVALKPSPLRWKLWHQAQNVNAQVKELTEKDVHDQYADVTVPMLGADGQPRKDIFRDDGLHMNLKGYDIWNKLLTPILAH